MVNGVVDTTYGTVTNPDVISAATDSRGYPYDNCGRWRHDSMSSWLTFLCV